jgi:hypothetical protein
MSGSSLSGSFRCLFARAWTVGAWHFYVVLAAFGGFLGVLLLFAHPVLLCA